MLTNDENVQDLEVSWKIASKSIFKFKYLHVKQIIVEDSLVEHNKKCNGIKHIQVFVVW